MIISKRSAWVVWALVIASLLVSALLAFGAVLKPRAAGVHRAGVVALAVVSKHSPDYIVRMSYMSKHAA